MFSLMVFNNQNTVTVFLHIIIVYFTYESMFLIKIYKHKKKWPVVEIEFHFTAKTVLDSYTIYSLKRQNNDLSKSKTKKHI